MDGWIRLMTELSIGLREIMYPCCVRVSNQASQFQKQT